MNAASERRAEALFALWAEGMPVRKIAAAIGASPAVTQRLLEKAREKRRPFGRREERVSSDDAVRGRPHPGGAAGGHP